MSFGPASPRSSLILALMFRPPWLADDLSVDSELIDANGARDISGMNYRYDRADSETCSNGTLDTPAWRATEPWLLQGGAMFEDTQLTGTSLTPRSHFSAELTF